MMKLIDKIKNMKCIKEYKGFSKIKSTLIIEFLVIFVTEILTKILLGTLMRDWTIVRICFSSIFISIILTLITTNIHRNARKVLLIIANFFIVLYAWLQLGFINFLGAFMSMGNAEQGTKITSYIGDFLKAYQFKLHTLWIIFIIFIIYLIFEKRILKSGYEDRIDFKNWKTYLKYICSLIITGGLFFVTLVTPFMQNKYQTISNINLFKYPSNPTVTIKNFGTTVYFFLDLKGTIFGSVSTDEYVPTEPDNVIDNGREVDDSKWEALIEEETNTVLNSLNNYFINRPIPDKNEYTGIFEGKNLIMIMMESLGEAPFSEEYKEYFPTLYKLYSEGMTGVNNYSPRNNCATGESEMTSQISLYSIETTCTVNTYKKNVYPEALMSMLAKNGYYTSAYHDYTDQYYYRKTFEYNLGSQKYYGIYDLGMKFNSIYKEWPSDVVFMENAIPKFINEDKFASYMITVTAHTPYMYSSEFGNKYIKDFDDLNVNKSAKRYLSKVKVLDLALEKLLNELEESGKLDDTVLVLFGDHYPYGLSESEYASIAKYDTKTNQETDRTPFIIYNSQMESQKITKYTSPLDYVPTILNLFGIEYDPRYYMGHDMFSDYDDYVVFPDNSWQSPYGFYSAAKGEFVQNEEAEILTDDKIIAINNEINDMRNMSGLAIKKNYFKYLFEYLEKEDEIEESTIKEE